MNGEEQSLEVPECETVFRYGGPQGEEDDSVSVSSTDIFYRRLFPMNVPLFCWYRSHALKF